ncbi:MAG: DinB family protein [Candidatus Solibacter sp.]
MKLRLFALMLAAAPVFAQSGIKEALAKHWKSSGDFTIAVAKAMPADLYTFRPNPEEMNFGQLMAHIGLANLSACTRASGMTRPNVPDKIMAWSKDSGKIDVDRDLAIQFLTDTFAFCSKAVDSMTPEKLGASITAGNQQMTGFEVLWSYFTHTAHHRGQAEVYMRVKGIKPPDYVF